MSHTTTQPSPVYVFVVLSLAAFLTMFMFCRRPGITYRTEVSVKLPLKDQPSAGQIEEMRQQTEEQLLTPESLLDVMNAAKMIQGPVTPEKLDIARNIRKRMNVRFAFEEDAGWLRISLLTARPNAALNLLNAIPQQLLANESKADTTSAPQVFPARITWRRGGTIDGYRWFLLTIASACVGAFGLVLRDRAENPRLLISNDQAERVLPVVGDFSDEQDEELIAARNAVKAEQRSRRKSLKTAMRIAEVAVAAVFLLMVFHLATKDTLLDRFVANPLAAYGEVLTYVIG